MKKLYLVVIGLLLFNSINGFAQSCSEMSFGFSSQSEVDNFHANYPTCTTVGGISIYGSNINNLNGLSQITTVLGNVDIASVDNGLDLHYPLTDISGLNNISSIGAQLSLIDVPNLSANNLFPNLTSIGGQLLIGNKTPTTLNGFNNLTSIGASFSLIDSAVTSLNGFASLQTIGLTMVISDNNFLTSMSGFGNLSHIYGSFAFYRNPVFIQFPNFQSLTTIDYDFNISYCNSLTSLTGFNHLQTVHTSDIRNNNSLTSLAGLSGLTNVNAFALSLNPLLIDVSALTNLHSSDYISISDNPLLSICNASGICNSLACLVLK